MMNLELSRKINKITSDVEHLLAEDFKITIGEKEFKKDETKIPVSHYDLVDYVSEAFETQENIFAEIDYPKVLNIKKDDGIIKTLLEIGIIFDVYDGDNYKFTFYDSDDNPLNLDVIKPDKEDGEIHSVYSTEIFINFLKKSCLFHNVIIRINNFNEYQIF